MTGKISEDADTVLDGTEKFAVARGGINYGPLATSVAAWLASLAQTLTNKTLASPIMTGNPVAPTPSPGDNDTSVATTAFVAAALAGAGGGVPADTIPLPDATPGVVGASTKFARQDHVHPTDTSRVAKTGDVMTGPLTINYGAGRAFTVSGKEHPPSLSIADAYASFQSANGGYGALSIGGRDASPYSPWLQSHNSAGTVLPLEINAAGGDITLGNSGYTVTVGGSLSAFYSATMRAYADKTNAGAIAACILTTAPLDAASVSLDGYMSLHGGAVATDRRMAIQCIENGVSYRPVTVGEEGISALLVGSPKQWLAASGTKFEVTTAANQHLGIFPGAGTTMQIGNINDALNAWGTIGSPSPWAFAAATASTSPSTGAVVVTGGLGVGGRINCGGTLDVAGGNITCVNSIIAPSLVAQDGATPFVTLNNTGGGDNARMLFQNSGANRHQIISQAGSYSIYNGASSAGVYLNGQAANAWTAISDARLKDDVEPLTVLDMLGSFQAIRYTYRPTGVRELGILAQDQVDQWPELIKRGTDGELKAVSDPLEMAGDIWGAQYDRFGVIALQGVKELLARIEALEAALARATN